MKLTFLIIIAVAMAFLLVTVSDAQASYYYGNGVSYGLPKTKYGYPIVPYVNKYYPYYGSNYNYPTYPTWSNKVVVNGYYDRYPAIVYNTPHYYIPYNYPCGCNYGCGY